MFVLTMPDDNAPRSEKARFILEAGLAQCEAFKSSRDNPSQDLLDDIEAYKIILASKAKVAEYALNLDENIWYSARKIAREKGWMK